MDNLDTLSDSSQLSNAPGCISSNASSISDLSVYQGEYFQLQQLLKPINVLPNNIEDKIRSNSNQETVTSWYEGQIKNLSSQVENLSIENEKYRIALQDTERKEISSNSWIEQLLRQNRHLEVNLENANIQIERLIKSHSIKNDSSKISLLENKILHLERVNNKLNGQNLNLSNEVNQLKLKRNETENEYEHLKLLFNDVKLELTAKNNCVVELKGKISEQYIQLQKTNEENVKLQHSLESLCAELEFVNKTQQWYKIQLHNSQEDKITLIKEISKNKDYIAVQEKEKENLKLELNKLHCKFDETCTTTLKEKEILLKQLENVSVIPKNETLFNFNSTNGDLENLKRYYESDIGDLTKEVVKIKENFEEQQESLKELSTQHGSVLSKNVVLQKSIEEQKIIIDDLKDSKETLRHQLSLISDRNMALNGILLNLKNKVAVLEVELSAKTQQNNAIQEAIHAVKEQFKVFKVSYNNLKNELNRKNKELLQLQMENQEIFMKSSWKACELESIKEQELKISSLEQELQSLTKKEMELNYENGKLSRESEVLNKRNEEHLQKIAEYQKNLKIQEILLNELKVSENEKASRIADLEDNINILKEEIHLRDNNWGMSLNSLTGTPFNEEVTKFVLNNCAHFSNNLLRVNGDIVEVIKSICDMCKVDIGNFLSNENHDHDIKSLLSEVDMSFKKMQSDLKANENLINELKGSITKIKGETLLRLQGLENRCQNLQKKTGENSDILFNVLIKNDDSIDEKMKHLHSVLQVKVREQKEKQRRYEINYRTLLRKVKEHMKGRNVAEKHNLYLQNLHKDISQELGKLKGNLSEKILHVTTLTDDLNRYINCNAELKERIDSLELKVTEECKQCTKFNMMKQYVEELEENLRSKTKILNGTVDNQEIIENLKKVNQEMSLKISILTNEHQECSNKIVNLVEESTELKNKLAIMTQVSEQEKVINSKLRDELRREKDSHSGTCAENENLCRSLEQASEMNNYLQKELETSNSALQQKCEELAYLEMQKKLFDDNYSKREIDTQKLISTLKAQLQLGKKEMDNLKNERYFLQRLCNDLKVALKIHVQHNKVFKEHYNSRKESNQFGSLPLNISDFPIPSKFNDGYIERLLQEHKAPLQDKPLSDIQGCLDSLRKEISVLQKQIVEKNVCLKS